MNFTFDGMFNGEGTERTTVYDDAGMALALGAEQQLGRAGAGGGAFAIEGHPEYCIKLFHAADLEDEEKRDRILVRLRAALERRECQRNPRLAWPLGAVKDRGGRTIGYAMRRIPPEFKPFRALFGGAAAVSRCFPGWGRKELARAAKAFVDTVRWLDGLGIRPADFNPSNFMAAPDGRIMLLDCDSFEVRGRDGTVHTSDVFYPDCAAPEILREPGMAGEARTKEQTRFSAALVAYQLLMEGGHPYAFAGEAADGSTTGSPADNIRAGTCPLGADASCRMAPFWYRLWSWLTGPLKADFVRTFREGNRDSAARATLGELSAAIQQFQRECARTPERNELAPATKKTPGAPGGAGGGWNGGSGFGGGYRTAAAERA